jgi:DnaJ-class molecular chaperone
MKLTEDHYVTLGVSTDATEKEIQDSYRSKIRLLHPDVNKDPEAEQQFLAIQKAYQIIMDPEERAAYNSETKILDKETVHNEFSSITDKIRKEREMGIDRFVEEEEDVPEEKEPEEKSTPFFKKIFNLFNENAESSQSSKKQLGHKSTHKLKKINKDELFGERIYHFTISSLESILGTKRTLVVKDEGHNERKISVKIPPGFTDQNFLKIPIKGKKGEVIKIQVTIEQHQFLKRNLLDISLEIPYGVDEEAGLDEITVFTVQAEIKIKIPEKSDKKLRLKGHGLKNTKTGEVGDFTILPIIMAGKEDSLEEVQKKVKAKREELLNLLRPLHS